VPHCTLIIVNIIWPMNLQNRAMLLTLCDPKNIKIFHKIFSRCSDLAYGRFLPLASVKFFTPNLCQFFIPGLCQFGLDNDDYAIPCFAYTIRRNFIQNSFSITKRKKVTRYFRLPPHANKVVALLGCCAVLMDIGWTECSETSSTIYRSTQRHHVY